MSTCLPSRITVTRWQISKTSSSRWEMNSTAAPRVAQGARPPRTAGRPRPRTGRPSARPSRSPARPATAPWRSPRSAGRRSTGRGRSGQGRAGRPAARTARPPASRISLPVDPPARPQRLAAHEDVLRDRQVGEEGRLLVDDRDARRPCAAAGPCRVTGLRRRSSSSPDVRLVHPGQHLHHRWTCPRRSRPAAHAPRPAYSSADPSTTACTAPNDFAACRSDSTGPAGPAGQLAGRASSGLPGTQPTLTRM